MSRYVAADYTAPQPLAQDQSLLPFCIDVVQIDKLICDGTKLIFPFEVMIKGVKGVE